MTFLKAQLRRSPKRKTQFSDGLKAAKPLITDKPVKQTSDTKRKDQP
ncbi:hypothetical protein HMPREF9123_1939 [Neisseria bacilliformis ATCC BAA-1200]|uniref:Uncharacterized protein n=1 Tax=Neisseria bacilliformis ATCC BAA-1200 TaxID=888742 RepID=F2BDY3_9NEIS|nr:hypothetical protein HMPREF9123_1939 [Neisseria bacilliformis ATCC BAA-1200]